MLCHVQTYTIRCGLFVWKEVISRFALAFVEPEITGDAGRGRENKINSVTLIISLFKACISAVPEVYSWGGNTVSLPPHLSHS